MENTFVPVYRVALVREYDLSVVKGHLTAPEDAADMVRRYLREPDREVFVVLVLSTKNDVIGINTVSVGTLDATLVHPREVFKPALLLNAASVIVAHNHPSGDPTPSPEDREVTRRLVEAGKLIGIDVLDHVVIGEHSHVSLKERGMI